jgi:hypothetical protein
MCGILVGSDTLCPSVTVPFRSSSLSKPPVEKPKSEDQEDSGDMEDIEEDIEDIEDNASLPVACFDINLTT